MFTDLSSMSKSELMSEEQDSRYNTIGPVQFFLFDWLAVGGLFEALEKSFLPSQSILPKQSNDNDASPTDAHYYWEETSPMVAVALV